MKLGANQTPTKLTPIPHKCKIIKMTNSQCGQTKSIFIVKKEKLTKRTQLKDPVPKKCHEMKTQKRGRSRGEMENEAANIVAEKIRWHGTQKSNSSPRTHMS
jgi:hypothetical protein